MNDLDKRIAELKGWEYVPAGTELFIHGRGATVAEGWIQKIGPMKQFRAAFNCDWSGSDSKALELVDEMCKDSPDRKGKFRFLLHQGYDFPNLIPDNHWWANFFYSKGFKHPRERVGEAEAPTRPEAICRAWIAAMEWMRGKKG